MEQVGDNNNNHFPTTTEFEKEEEKPIPWSDVECHTPFKVLEMNEISTVKGNAIIQLLKHGQPINSKKIF